MKNAAQNLSDFSQKMLLKYQDAHDLIVGVDLASDSIRLAQVKKQAGQQRVRKIAQITLPEGSEERLLSDPGFYSAKLLELLKKEKIKTRYAAVAIPEHLAVVKTLTLPLMSVAQIEQAIAFGAFWENFVTLSEDVSAYSIHYEVVVRREDQQTMDMLFVAAKHSDIFPYTQILAGAGLTPIIVDVRCFALFNALQMEGKISLEDRAAYLKCDAQAQYLYILERGEPFFYEVFVADQDHENMASRAEDYEFVRRLSSQVQQIISTHEAVQGVEKITQIHVLETMRSSGVLVQKMGMLLAMYNVSLVKLIDTLSLPNSNRIALFNDSVPGRSLWAVPLGLAVRNWDAFATRYLAHADNVNPLPHVDHVKHVSRIKTLSRLLISSLAVIVLACVGGSYFWLAQEERSYKGQIASLRLMGQKHTEIAADAEKYKAAVAGLSGLRDTKKKLASNQAMLIAAYQVIYAGLPYGIWLDSARFSAPYTLEIAGNALGDQNILELIRMLNENSLFEKVSLKTMQIKPVQGEAAAEVKHFSIQLLLKLQG